MKTALPAGIILIGTLLVGAGVPIPAVSPESVIPPCYVPSHVKVGDWRIVRIDPPRSFRLPPTFVYDSSAKYIEGGKRWTSGGRKFEMINGLWGEGSFGSSGASYSPGYSECRAILAGTPFRLITTYNTNHKSYVAIAVPVAPTKRSLKHTLAFIGQSPDSADQKLFLAIFRTLRVDSSGAAE